MTTTAEPGAGTAPGAGDDGRVDAADEEMVRQLTQRTRAEGLSLTGLDGLLGRLTKVVLEGALPLAQLRAALPALGNPANLHPSVSLTLKEFRFGFGNALPEDESGELFEKWTIPSPARCRNS